VRFSALTPQGGADVNWADDEGDTPLIFAARARSAPCVAALLAYGASLAHFNKYGVLTRGEGGTEAAEKRFSGGEGGVSEAFIPRLCVGINQVGGGGGGGADLKNQMEWPTLLSGVFFKFKQTSVTARPEGKISLRGA
jgi:hypothetical protein